MSNKIFYLTFGACALLILCVNATLLYHLEQVFEHQIKDNLEKFANSITDITFENNAISSFDNAYRITLLDINGNVVFDNFTDSENLENHTNRL